MAGIWNLPRRAPTRENIAFIQWLNAIPADFSGITANPRVEPIGSTKLSPAHSNSSQLKRQISPIRTAGTTAIPKWDQWLVQRTANTTAQARKALAASNSL
jgi:hypothetical protein